MKSGKFDPNMKGIASDDCGNELLWPNDVVYNIYCNDDLTTLPVKILEQMRDHLQSIIDAKQEVK